MTDQCHAGTALLIREYQVEYRRASLTPVAFSTASDLPVARPDPLDRSFHIRSTTFPAGPIRDRIKGIQSSSGWLPHFEVLLRTIGSRERADGTRTPPEERGADTCFINVVPLPPV